MLARRNGHMLWLVLAATLAGGCGDGVTDPPLTTQEEETDDPCAVLGSVGMGESVSGQLSDGDCPGSAGAVVDRWALVLSQEASVRIDLTSDVFDTFLELHDQAGRVIRTDDDGGAGLDARIMTSLPSGTFTIVARAYAPGMRGSYRLAVSEAPDCSAVGAIALGETVSGAFEDTDCLVEWGGLSDAWSLDLASSTRVRLTLASPVAPVEVLVRDAFGQIVAGAPSWEPDVPARVDVELEAGAWTVVALSPDEARTGSYALTAEVSPPCDPGTDVVLGEVTAGALDAEGCLLDGWAPADSLRLVLDRDTELEMQLKSPDFPPFLLVRDETGRDVAAAWDEGGTGVARTRQRLPAGAYAIYVVSGAHEAFGSYELLVSEVDCGEPGAVALGSSVEGALGHGDCARTGGAFRDVWILDVEEEQGVRIDLGSTDFDPYLILRDESGNELARNDDGGPGLDARIDRTLAPGRYEILATSFSAGVVGAYTLSVGAAPATVVSAATSGGPLEPEKIAAPAEEASDPAELLGVLRGEIAEAAERLRDAWRTRK